VSTDQPAVQQLIRTRIGAHPDCAIGSPCEPAGFVDKLAGNVVKVLSDVFATHSKTFTCHQLESGQPGSCSEQLHRVSTADSADGLQERCGVAGFHTGGAIGQRPARPSQTHLPERTGREPNEREVRRGQPLLEQGVGVQRGQSKEIETEHPGCRGMAEEEAVQRPRHRIADRGTDGSVGHTCLKHAGERCRGAGTELGRIDVGLLGDCLGLGRSADPA
jgi:hypothetical protein